MRSDWVPVSASALVTGAMALVLAQMLNPAGGDVSPVDQVLIIKENSARWLAMSVLFFVSAVAIILGLPTVMVLFDVKRGRGLGLLGIGMLALGCIGVAGLSALMLFFRALALEDAIKLDKVDAVFSDPGLDVMLTIWTYAFLVGVLIVALALLRARPTPTWVSLLLIGFLGIELLVPYTGPLVSLIGLMTLAAGLTGVATSATSPERRTIVARGLG